MNLVTHRLLPVLALAAVLAGCASSHSGNGPNTLYDFGPATAGETTAAAPPLAAVVVTDATGSPALDSERIFYRLNYADPLQARMYANSRWSSTPLAMVTARLRSRIAQAGVQVLTPVDAAAALPILRIEVDDFTHSFDSQTQSYGQLVLRASLFQGHKLQGQRTFSRKAGADSADAAGGAHALAAATDAVAADMLAWMATVSVRNP
jgi:cholesterol transport system auxiliary component